MDRLDEIRKSINKLDLTISKLLEERYKYVLEIGQYKKGKSIDILDEKREIRVIENVTNDKGDAKNYIANIYKHIIEESKNIENDIID